MGSLMAGWSTAPTGSEAAFKRSSSSLTKEEVEKFWRNRNSKIQEHHAEAQKHAATLSPQTKLPPSPESPADGSEAVDDAAALSEKFREGLARAAWWTRSQSAFLNDPPAAEPKQSNYTPQFDVASSFSEHDMEVDKPTSS